MISAQSISFYDLLTIRNEGPQFAEKLLLPKGWRLVSTKQIEEQLRQEAFFNYRKDTSTLSPYKIFFRFSEEYYSSIFYETVTPKHAEDILVQIKKMDLNSLKKRN